MAGKRRGDNWIMVTENDARRTLHRRIASLRSMSFLAIAVIGLFQPAVTHPALAQAIVASINGDPITTIDIDERMKMLRVLRKPSTREAAIESLFTDRLESQESGKFGVELKDNDLSQGIVRTAKEMKMQPEALLAALNKAGVSADHIKAHFRSDLSFEFLVRAMNKGVEASEEQVRTELAKQGGKAASGTEYRLREVIFAIPHGATQATLTERAHEAEELRSKFNDCDSGIPAARALTDVTVRDPLVKTAIELNEGVRDMLDKTPTGHLTPPQRSTEGIEMLAVCSKDIPKDDSAARTAIAQKILDARIEADEARRLKELRARAVVVNH